MDFADRRGKAEEVLPGVRLSLQEGRQGDFDGLGTNGFQPPKYHFSIYMLPVL